MATSKSGLDGSSYQKTVCDDCGAPAERFGEGWANCAACHYRGLVEHVEQFRTPGPVNAFRIPSWGVVFAAALCLLVIFVKFCWTHS
jgi:hypothetical protein